MIRSFGWNQGEGSNQVICFGSAQNLRFWSDFSIWSFRYNPIRFSKGASKKNWKKKNCVASHSLKVSAANCWDWATVRNSLDSSLISSSSPEIAKIPVWSDYKPISDGTCNLIDGEYTYLITLIKNNRKPFSMEENKVWSQLNMITLIKFQFELS